MTEYLTSENLAEIANDPSNILFYVQSNIWLSLKLNTSAQKKVMDSIVVFQNKCLKATFRLRLW